jgi:hypothetical protein
MNENLNKSSDEIMGWMESKLPELNQVNLEKWYEKWMS